MASPNHDALRAIFGDVCNGRPIRALAVIETALNTALEHCRPGDFDEVGDVFLRVHDLLAAERKAITAAERALPAALDRTLDAVEILFPSFGDDANGALETVEKALAHFEGSSNLDYDSGKALDDVRSLLKSIREAADK